MTEWAKVYTDILGDPKLMRAARKGHRGLELTPWLVVFAKAANDGGRLTVGGEPIEPADLVPLIPGSTEKSVQHALASLENLGILLRNDDGALQFAAWTERQSPPSTSRDAIRERVKQHRERRKSLSEAKPVTTSNEVVTPSGNATEKSREEKKREELTPPPPFGADAPVPRMNGHGSGKHLTLHRTANASVPVVLNRLTGFLTEVSQQAEREYHRDQLRDVMVDLAFAYWAKKTRHEHAKLDRKRANLLRKRLVEGDDNVHALLFVVDGALKDDTIMGRRPDSSRKYDGISTIYRDWEQVERLAGLGGYAEGATHPMAKKYLEGAMPMAGVQHGAVAAGN